MCVDPTRQFQPHLLVGIVFPKPNSAFNLTSITHRFFAQIAVLNCSPLTGELGIATRTAMLSGFSSCAAVPSFSPYVSRKSVDNSGSHSPPPSGPSNLGKRKPFIVLFVRAFWIVLPQIVRWLIMQLILFLMLPLASRFRQVRWHLSTHWLFLVEILSNNGDTRNTGTGARIHSHALQYAG